MSEEPKNIVAEPAGDYFGGTWTKEKISIFMKYCHAYLEIMKKQTYKFNIL